MSGFVGSRLRSAREARGLTAVALAEMIDVSRQAVSQYERGLSSPSDESFQKICAVLNLRRQFFIRPPLPDDDAPIFYRSLTAATKTARARAEKRFDWLKEIIITLRGMVSFPKVNLPDFSTPSNPFDLRDAEIEDLARKTRRFWALGDAPISNVVWLLENNGVLISRHELMADTLDAFSQWSKILGCPCVILGADKSSAARSRFDAAHELGHLVLHRNVSQKEMNKRDVFRHMESQAHRFAGAFLMPEETFSADLIIPQLDQMKMLKAKWKVAIGAMIMRASHLGLISDEKAERRLWINRTQRGWRTREPLDDVLEPEQPTYLKKCIDTLLTHNIITQDAIADIHGLTIREVESLCALPSGFLSEETEDPGPTILAFRSSG